MKLKLTLVFILIVSIAFAMPTVTIIERGGSNTTTINTSLTDIKGFETYDATCINSCYFKVTIYLVDDTKYNVSLSYSNKKQVTYQEETTTIKYKPNIINHTINYQSYITTDNKTVTPILKTKTYTFTEYIPTIETKVVNKVRTEEIKNDEAYKRQTDTVNQYIMEYYNSSLKKAKPEAVIMATHSKYKDINLEVFKGATE